MDVAGHTLKDQIRNSLIRNELNIFNLNIIIQNSRLNCVHHIERMEAERIPKELMGYALRGTRSFGRPKLLWKNRPVSQRNRS
jgi:hypothetical protein